MPPIKSSRKSVHHHIYRQHYADYTSKIKLYNAAKGSKDFVQRLTILKRLAIHNGCVNCITWSEDGRLLLSGSDDQHLIITDAYNYKILTNYKTSLRGNIFCAKFLPCSSDSHIVSCSGDGMILFTDLNRLNETRQNLFTCHSGTTYKLVTIPNDPAQFLSCGEDFTVRCFDLRMKQKCNKQHCDEDVLINCKRAVTALAVNPWAPYQLAVGSADGTVRLYDRRMLHIKPEAETPSPDTLCSFTVPNLSHGAYRITSLAFSPEGEEILANYSSEYLYLFNVKNYNKCELSPTRNKIPAPSQRSNKSIATQSNFPAVRRLRLRGDWSDTGPDARPEQELTNNPDSMQARPALHAILMRRMTNAIFRLLNNPATRAALRDRGNDSLAIEQQGAGEEMQNENEGENEEGNSILEGNLQLSTSESQSADNNPQINPSSSQNNPSLPLSSSLNIPSTSGSVRLPSFQQTYSSLVNEPKKCISEELLENFYGPSYSKSKKSRSMSVDSDDSDSVFLDEGKNLNSKPAHRINSPSSSVDPSNQNSQQLSSVSKFQNPPKTVATQTEFPVPSGTLDSFFVNNFVPQVMTASNILRQTDDSITMLSHSDSSSSSSSSSSSTSSSSSSAVSDQNGSSTQQESEPPREPSSICDNTNMISSMSSFTNNITSNPGCSVQSTTAVDPSLLSQNLDKNCFNLNSLKLDGNKLGCNRALSSQFPLETKTSISSVSDLKTAVNQSSSSNSQSAGTSMTKDFVQNQSYHSADNPVSKSSVDIGLRENNLILAGSSNAGLAENSEQQISSSGSSSLIHNFDSDVSNNPSSLLAQTSSTVPLSSRNVSSNDKANQTCSIESNYESSNSSTLKQSSNICHSSSAMPSTSVTDGNLKTNLNFSNISQPSNSSQNVFSNCVPQSSASNNITDVDDFSDDEEFSGFFNSTQSNVDEEKLKSNPDLFKNRGCDTIFESDNFNEADLKELEENEYSFIKQKYTGHRNARTMIKEATFWGNDYVMSGSDCGHVFIWDRWTAKLTMLLQADNHVVNCIQPHPFQPILATSGIDYDVKLWAPLSEESTFNEEKAEELMQRNIIMLEETKDTITVPASFAIRMLAFLNQIRRGRRPFPRANQMN